jgi:hypothetical protein
MKIGSDTTSFLIKFPQTPHTIFIPVYEPSELTYPPPPTLALGLRQAIILRIAYSLSIMLPHAPT